MGRASNFTEHLAGVIVRGIEAGLTDRAACGVADVPLRTFRRSVAEGKKLDEADDESTAPLAVFARMVEGARAMAAVRQIDDASRKDWKAAAWLLERLHPEDFGPPRVIGRDLDRLERRVNELACKLGLNAVGA
jgi:hypothetical protein